MASMIVAVSTRATLGHTGRALTAGPLTTLIYLLVTAAAMARVAAGIVPGSYMTLLGLAGLAWRAGFVLFLAVYGRCSCARAPGAEAVTHLARASPRRC